MTRIQLVLVDDWELRGDGSGDMRRLQFDTLSRILEVYERHGLRASINAEIMQQLHHLKFGAAHPELAALANEWEEVVKSAFRRGHDVQLHVHSQWNGATYEDGKWTLPGEWSILRHAPDDVRVMIRSCKEYLEGLLRTINPGYKCVSFRSGAWCIAPSNHMLDILADEGLTFDMSIVDGLQYDNEKVQLDYRNCDEPFLPFHPLMTDARRVSDAPSPIVCLPTFSFRMTPSAKLMHLFGHAGNKLCRKANLPLIWPTPANATPVPGTASGKAYTVWQQPTAKESMAKRTADYLLAGQVIVADLSTLNARLMKQMIADIRRRANATGWATVPVVLENHTKDVGDFGPIEEFAAYVASQPDLEVITLQEVHENLRAGHYKPVMRERLASAS